MSGIAGVCRYESVCQWLTTGGRAVSLSAGTLLRMHQKHLLHHPPSFGPKSLGRPVRIASRTEPRGFKHRETGLVLLCVIFFLFLESFLELSGFESCLELRGVFLSSQVGNRPLAMQSLNTNKATTSSCSLYHCLARDCKWLLGPPGFIFF